MIDTSACQLGPGSGCVAPAFPPDEDARIAELRSLKMLDTPAEERFDRIVRLTTMLLDAPISYVALVDRDRQWFKSRLGMEPSETPRQTSFCGHAILQDKALIIPDARKDMRFAGNPLVIARGNRCVGPPGTRLAPSAYWIGVRGSSMTRSSTFSINWRNWWNMSSNCVT
jgi:hypothetical protein